MNLNHSTEIRANDKKSPLLNGTNSSDSSILVSHEHTPPLPMTLDARNNSTLVYDDDLELSRVSMNTHHSNDAPCARIRNICKHDFRSEGWYRENLLLIIVIAIAGASVILPMANQSTSNVLVVYYIVGILLPFGFICLMTIPLCGIVHLLQNTPLSERHFLSVIRLTLDPGKAYRICRWIYFISCPIIMIVFNAKNKAYTKLLNAILPPGVWSSLCVLVFFGTLFMGVHSVWSQVFA